MEIKQGHRQDSETATIDKQTGQSVKLDLLQADTLVNGLICKQYCIRNYILQIQVSNT